MISQENETVIPQRKREKVQPPRRGGGREQHHPKQHRPKKRSGRKQTPLNEGQTTTLLYPSSSFRLVLGLSLPPHLSPFGWCCLSLLVGGGAFLPPSLGLVLHSPLLLLV